MKEEAMRPYEALFSVGWPVQIADITKLEISIQTWKHRIPLRPEQLAYAGKYTTVTKVGFYHGGDPLYELDQVPGVWHEQCLKNPTGDATRS